MSEISADSWPSRLKVGSIEVPYLSRDEAQQRFDRSIHDGEPLRIAFCNASVMLRALIDPDFARTLKYFLLLNDGVGMNLCSRLFTGRPFPDNLNGTDLVPEVLRRSVVDLRIYLLGGAPGTADVAARRLAEAHPRHSVVGARHGFLADGEIDAVLADIDRASPDLLLVGMGNPLQEEFIAASEGRLNVPVVMAVGAFLDFTAGNVVRAPRPIRAMRAEWLFRLAQEPRRLGRRYTVDVALFFIMIGLVRLKAQRLARRQS